MPRGVVLKPADASVPATINGTHSQMKDDDDDDFASLPPSTHKIGNPTPTSILSSPSKTNNNIHSLLHNVGQKIISKPPVNGGNFIDKMFGLKSTSSAASSSKPLHPSAAPKLAKVASPPSSPPQKPPLPLVKDVKPKTNGISSSKKKEEPKKKKKKTPPKSKFIDSEASVNKKKKRKKPGSGDDDEDSDDGGDDEADGSDLDGSGDEDDKAAIAGDDEEEYDTDYEPGEEEEEYDFQNDGGSDYDEENDPELQKPAKKKRKTQKEKDDDVRAIQLSKEISNLSAKLVCDEDTLTEEEKSIIKAAIKSKTAAKRCLDSILADRDDNKPKKPLTEVHSIMLKVQSFAKDRLPLQSKANERRRDVLLSGLEKDFVRKEIRIYSITRKEEGTWKYLKYVYRIPNTDKSAMVIVGYNVVFNKDDPCPECSIVSFVKDEEDEAVDEKNPFWYQGVKMKNEYGGTTETVMKEMFGSRIRALETDPPQYSRVYEWKTEKSWLDYMEDLKDDKKPLRFGYLFLVSELDGNLYSISSPSSPPSSVSSIAGSN